MLRHMLCLHSAFKHVTNRAHGMRHAFHVQLSVLLYCSHQHRVDWTVLLQLACRLSRVGKLLSSNARHDSIAYA
jgi:hypothetical protein